MKKQKVNINLIITGFGSTLFSTEFKGNSMKTETHWKLALKILKNDAPEMPLKSRVAFAFGCIKPDFDMFSYLRGFKHKPFYGHNWGNAHSYIMRLSQKAEHKSLGSFGFGLLVHYLCDAFTFVHNEGFCGGLKAHAVYEKLLHTSLIENSRISEQFNSIISEKLSEIIENVHHRYMNLPDTVYKDIEFIIFAVNITVAVWKDKIYSVEKRCCAAR